jgi:hypothetical protein
LTRASLVACAAFGNTSLSAGSTDDNAKWEEYLRYRVNGCGQADIVVRILLQAPPYALLAKPAIKTTADLKGKTIIIGGAKDITRIFVERMLVPNGVKPNEVDYVFAGATSARST